MAHIGYTTVQRRSHLMPSLHSSWATLYHQWRNPDPAWIFFNHPPAPTKKGLMYVSATINGQVVCSLLDARAMHNFISEDETKCLGFMITKEGGTMKAVNSTWSLARNSSIKFIPSPYWPQIL